MDDKRFDDLSKRLASTRLTRLSLLRGLVGGAAAAVTAAVLSSGDADAKSKKRKGRKGSGAVAASGGNTWHPECRPAGHPCEGNQSCCADLSCEVTGPGNAKRCVEDSPPACGACNEPCCDGSHECDSGLTCRDHVCVPHNPDCGAQGQACCSSGSPCQGDLTCQSGTCQPACGAAGQICCSGNTCSSGLECQGGFCVVPCGGSSQICCANNACGPNLTCTGDPARCQPCGAETQICCAGNACNAPLLCAGGVCQPGVPGGGCTTDDQCPAGSVCDSGTCVSFGGGCQSGETPFQCCIRSVKKGCTRKQQSGHARKNCLRKGKRRCNELLGST